MKPALLIGFTTEEIDSLRTHLSHYSLALNIAGDKDAAVAQIQSNPFHVIISCRLKSEDAAAIKQASLIYQAGCRIIELGDSKEGLVEELKHILA